MSTPGGPLLVLGVGNVLMTDEGVGVRVAEALRAAPESLPPGVEIVDGGTLGLELLPLVEDAAALLLIDAVRMGAAPGTVVTLRGAELRARLGGALSAHQVGVGDLLAVARLQGTLPEATSLVGIEPESVAVSLELSPSVAAALPEAVRAARAEIQALVSASAPAEVTAHA